MRLQSTQWIIEHLRIQPHKVRDLTLMMQGDGEGQAEGKEDAADEDTGLQTKRWIRGSVIRGMMCYRLLGVYASQRGFVFANCAIGGIVPSLLHGGDCALR